ncbi:MAG: recombinase family protein [Rhodanobacter sp.]|jgi:DNA invertase Pin-like site-specific DNA recombinase
MPKGYVYIRFSTAEQSQGDSSGRQMRLARRYAELHPEMQIEVVEDPVFVDSGVSSFYGGNLASDKALGQFLQAVDSGVIEAGSVLLVESLDRLSRQEIFRAQRAFLDILNRQITIITTSDAEAKVYGGQSGLVDLITMLVRMERAHEESLLKSKRVKAAWETKRKNAQQNTIITKVCPQWLSVAPDGKSFVVDEEKADVVRRIFGCAESMGYQSIARYLNESKVPPFSTKSKGWQSSRIVKILLNPAVIGTYQPHTITHVQDATGTRRRAQPAGPPIENYYPAIVDDALFNRVQLQKASRSKNAAGRKGPRVTNLFSHVAKCGHCGNNMVLVQKGPAWGPEKYLVCSIARRGAGCEYHGWPYEPLEEAFLSYCQNVDLSEMVPEEASNQALLALRKRLQALRGELQSASNTSERLMADVVANGGNLPKSVQDFLEKSDTNVERLRSEIHEAEVLLGQEEERQRDQKGFSNMFRSLIELAHELRTP